jgi:hypothetical protein
MPPRARLPTRVCKWSGSVPSISVASPPTSNASSVRRGCQSAARTAEAFVADLGHLARPRFFHRKIRRTEGEKCGARAAASGSGAARRMARRAIKPSELLTFLREISWGLAPHAMGGMCVYLGRGGGFGRALIPSVSPAACGRVRVPLWGVHRLVVCCLTHRSRC